MTKLIEQWMLERAELLAQRDELLRETVSLRKRLELLNAENCELRRQAGRPLSRVVMAQMRSRSKV